ncbi:MAG: hypothetical protein AAF497_06060 [Planctomycetota bacterium]
MPTDDFEFPIVPKNHQRYDIGQSYAWNYDHAPQIPDEVSESVSKPDCDWVLCGVPMPSPIGIAAGPLLNGNWLLHYASLGFGFLTYKTVRSQSRSCYPLPNLQPIVDGSISHTDETATATEQRTSTEASWAVSFGMPSTTPTSWREDVRQTRERLASHQKLSVSVVATPQADWTIEQVAEDYAQCAEWAEQAGADFVELNLSCPNVASCDGQLFRDAQKAAFVFRDVHQRIEQVPLLAKIGPVAEADEASRLVDELTRANVSALVMINCIPARVMGTDGPMFDSQPRGIAGPAIFDAVVRQVELFRSAVDSLDSPTEIVAVGGIRDKEDVRRCLNAGASAIQMATAIM